MNSMRAQTKQSCRGKWAAMLAAVIVVCAVVTYLFFWQTAEISNGGGAPATVLKRDKALNALLNSKSSLALETTMAPLQRPPADSPAWRTILANLAMQTGRTLAWDAERELILNDPEANKLLARPYREPWVHPDPATV